MTTFSVTERGTFKVCRRQHNFSSLNREGLENITPNKNLLLGSLVHATLADWNMDPGINPVKQFDYYATGAEANIRERYQIGYGFKMSEMEMDYYRTEVFDLGHAMMTNYLTKFEWPLPAGYHLIAAEQTVTTPVSGTEHCACKQMCDCELCGWDQYRAPSDYRSGDLCLASKGCPCIETHFLESTFDGLVEVEGRVFILEHKTYNARPSKNELEMNDQFLAYLWVAKQFGAVGVFYNGLWKRPTPPKGRTFDDLFLRTLLTRHENEIAEFGAMLPYELRDMEEGFPYPTRAWSSCPSCGFQDLCKAVSANEDYGALIEEHYTKRERSPAWRQ